LTVLGIVPARSGSKGIANKNLVQLAGVPLIAHTAMAARASRTLDRVVVSTDDERIAAVAREHGLETPFLRPSALAADDTPMLPVLQHAVSSIEESGQLIDVVVLLQPTSPLRRAVHIDSAVELLRESGADSVVSVIEVPHRFNPKSVMRFDGGRLQPYENAPVLTRRQDKPVLYARNGPAVLAVRRNVLMEQGALYGDDCRPLMMDPESSVDIDSPWDLVVAEAVLARRRASEGR